MGYLKEKSTLIIFERHSNLKYKYGNRVFFCTGYYVSTVGNNKTAVYRYVENQLKEDMMTDQITRPYRPIRKSTGFTRGLLFWKN